MYVMCECVQLGTQHFHLLLADSCWAANYWLPFRFGRCAVSFCLLHTASHTILTHTRIYLGLWHLIRSTCLRTCGFKYEIPVRHHSTCTAANQVLSSVPTNIYKPQICRMLELFNNITSIHTHQHRHARTTTNFPGNCPATVSLAFFSLTHHPIPGSKCTYSIFTTRQGFNYVFCLYFVIFCFTHTPWVV